MARATKKPREPQPPRGGRFEATVHPGWQDVALGRVADLDLDRLPDPHGGVRLLVSPAEAAELLDRGYEVRLHRHVPVAPLGAELVATDDAVEAWLAERVEGIPREEAP